ncbi:uncharacterized protein C8A04DRAFT_28075 [Dichotomopilus funicola]|uniref:Uncharacterized protein n=1 Tax=Dichotomopilus funicola TaxID=1934379 RepID=A0AAN6ZN92_9PEZI|nr:hypothetical protein C8A04DRAFT_28075 [Dichotomopilus funicola]
MSLKIENWQHSVSAPADEESAEPSSSKADGFTLRLSRAASELFETILRCAEKQTSKPIFRALQRQHGFFLLWCDGYGALAGDLDEVLAESRRLRNSTHRLLVSLCQTLADKLVGVLLAGLEDAAQRGLIDKSAQVRAVVETTTFAIPYSDSSESDTDSSDFNTDSESVCSSPAGEISVDEIIEDIETDIQCLVDLGPRYKEPIRDKVIVEEAARPKLVTTWDPAELLTSRIRHRYPRVDPKLAHSLGQANWDRAQRLYAEKERNLREAQKLREAQNLDEPQNLGEPQSLGEVEQPAAPIPESFSMPPGTIVASDFHDSGLGTSMATPSSYAETVMSYHGTNGGSIKIPPVPPEAMQGNPFTCDICGRKFRLPGANWKSFWK